MTPGVNKLGGTARVVKVDSATGVVDVRYVVEGGWERGIDPAYIRAAVLELAEKRSTLGRCRHCGSLRVDCRQGCEFYTAPTSVRLPPPAPQHRRLAGLVGSPSHGAPTEAGERRGDLGDGEGRRRDRGQHRYRRHRMSDGGTVDHRQYEDRPERRRRLPDDWDEEGGSIPGMEWSEDGSSGSGSGSGAPAGVRWENPGWHRRVGSDLSDQASPSRAHGSVSSADDAVAASEVRGRQPYRRGVRWPGSATESGSDSDLDLRRIRRGRENGSTRQRPIVRSDGSDDSGRRSGGRGSDSEQGSGEGGGRSLSPGVGRSGWRGDAGDADETGVALFLVAEGEEAARTLPSDIPDPTRGVSDPAVLRKELRRLLQNMEGRDASELEQGVAAVCR